jgi:hypothetical protein
MYGTVRFEDSKEWRLGRRSGMRRGLRKMRLKRKKLCVYAAAGVLAYFFYMTCLPIHLDIVTLARKTEANSIYNRFNS